MPMFKLCAQCGQLHDFDAGACQAVRFKKQTKAVQFRNTSRWQRKRTQIRERDKNLCQICLLDTYDTHQMYTYDNIEVNHIVPISEDVDRALDDDNLICLCSRHHKMADKGMIPRSIMNALTRPDRNLKAIRQMTTGL